MNSVKNIAESKHESNKKRKMQRINDTDDYCYISKD